MPRPEQAIEDVYRQNVEKLYKFFYFKVLNKQIAEDLTSETFMALAEKMPTLQKDKVHLEKYLYGIAKHKWSAYLREKYKNNEFQAENIDDFSHYVTEEVEYIQALPLKERAMRFIKMLPPKMQLIAMMRLIDGLTPTEIATKIQKPLNYVKVTLRRALRRLEELVAQSNLSAAGDTKKT